MLSKNEKDIGATYAFMKKVYSGNWQYRWKGTPHMSNMFKHNKRESILAQMYREIILA